MRKKIIFILPLFLSVIFTSCDPDVAGEGINLPGMEYAFKVSPDTGYLKVGDTFLMYAAISSTLSNGVKLVDGEIWVSVGRGDDVPRVSFDDVQTALNNDDYRIIIDGGGVKWTNGVSNQIHSFTFKPLGDSIIMAYKFIFLKRGLYQIGGFQSSFYEGSKGKTRCTAYFDVSDPHWNLVEMPNHPPPQPGEYGYRENYLIAVTD